MIAVRLTVRTNIGDLRGDLRTEDDAYGREAIAFVQDLADALAGVLIVSPLTEGHDFANGGVVPGPFRLSTDTGYEEVWKPSSPTEGDE